jgi:single-strand DNA-binding protein
MKNQVILIGYAGSDPEVRAFPSGDLVATVSVATSEKWRDRESGELKEHTEWHRVVFKDRGRLKLGERAQMFIRKGAKVYVQGPQRNRDWEADGIKHRTTEVEAQEFLLLDSMDARSNSTAKPAPEPAKASTNGKAVPRAPAYEPLPEFDDLPF